MQVHVGNIMLSKRLRAIIQDVSNLNFKYMTFALKDIQYNILFCKYQ